MGLLVGCAEPVEVREVSLIDVGAWTLMASDDPFDDAPEGATCPSASYGEETSFFEVDTGECTYASFGQPSQFGLDAGDPIHLLLWWKALVADAEAEAHVAVRLGDQVLLDEWVPIPDPGGIRVIDVVAESRIDAGVPVVFHLHNHGYNSWVFAELLATTEVPSSR